MPKLPDPTLPSTTLSAEPLPRGEIIPDLPGGDADSPPARASIDHVRPSPLRFVGPLLVILLLAAAGFALTRYLILPRLGRSEEVVTLTYWGLWEPESVMAPVIAKYEAEHPNVKIAYQMQSKTDYRERLQSALARGEGPDIARIHATWLPMVGSELSPATAQQFSVDELNQAFYPYAKEDLVRNNAVVAVPLMTDGLGLFVNNEILAATSSGVPTNWDDLRKTAFSLTRRDARGQITRAGVAMGTTGNVSHWPDILAALMLQNSVNLAQPDALVDARGRNLGADALRYYTMFAGEDRIWDETLPPDVVAFANGKVAMMFAPSWQAFQVLEINRDLDFSIHPIPQLTTQRQVTWASYWVEVVPRQSDNKAEAWDFLKYLSTQEGLQLRYAEAVKLRPFGEPYPRRDMAAGLASAKYVAPYVAQAPYARSWFMSSRTHDNGINDEIIAYWEDAVNAVIKNQESPEDAIATVAQGVRQVLGKYGVK